MLHSGEVSRVNIAFGLIVMGGCFYPIQRGSRDRPVGRDVIDEAKLCVDTAVPKGPRQVRQLYRFSHICINRRV